MEKDIETLELQNRILCETLKELSEWSDEDEAIKEDDDIKRFHPLNTKDFDTYNEALRMVSAKRSKYALVDLVNYLLVRIKELPDD